MRVLRGLLEVGALFLALFLVMPYIPSHEGFVHRFGAKQGVAIALFAASRVLRWRDSWWIALPEAAAFGAFAWALTESYNLL
ncbi:hypothetical protein ACLBKU_15280 [Erythrobacter sp. NE805]|uniref:hypothetical protein n=1 Tax=Erythrobacter sp. NE805 TaxID=3389875 RepID=UPI00396B2C2A